MKTLNLKCAPKLTIISFQNKKVQFECQLNYKFDYDVDYVHHDYGFIPEGYAKLWQWPENTEYFEDDIISLGTKIAKDAATKNPMIIWTQNLFVFTAIRVAVHNKHIDAKDVGIYYVQGPPDKINVVKIKIDSEGRYDQRPSGFFDQIDNLLMELLRPHDES